MTRASCQLPGWRTAFPVLFGVSLVVFSPRAYPQTKNIPRIGIVAGSGGAQISTPTLDGLRQGLRDLGYVDGKNIMLEYRYAEGKQERVPNFVAEFVRLNVDAIVVGSSAGIRAAKQATTTIPIVMVSVVDPVAAGTVDSLARPGRNITGLAILTRELSGKRLELLKEVLPSLRRIGVLWHQESPSSIVGFKEYTSIADALKLQLHSLQVQGPDPDFSIAFQAAITQKIAALITIGSPVLNGHPKQIAELALKNRLPSIYERNRFVEAAGLMSYGSNEREDWRRAAVYVDKILRGAKPADLPIEQPIKFELVITQNGQADRPYDSAEYPGESRPGDQVKQFWILDPSIKFILSRVEGLRTGFRFSIRTFTSNELFCLALCAMLFALARTLRHNQKFRAWGFFSWAAAINRI